MQSVQRSGLGVGAPESRGHRAAPTPLTHTHTHTHPFNGPLSGTTRVSLYQKGKTDLDFTKARDSEWQWHQLGRMQVCTLLQTDNHASTPPLSFLQAGCPSCHQTNSVRALKAPPDTSLVEKFAFPQSWALTPRFGLAGQCFDLAWESSHIYCFASC